MAEGRRSRTARPEEISLMDGDVSEFDPNVPDNDMDARLYLLLSNPQKTDLNKRQPLPRDKSLRIPSASIPRGLALHKGETHGPVPAPVTSPVQDRPDDIVALRPTPGGGVGPAQNDHRHATEAPTASSAPRHTPSSSEAYASNYYANGANNDSSSSNNDAGSGFGHVGNTNNGTHMINDGYGDRYGQRDAAADGGVNAFDRAVSAETALDPYAAQPYGTQAYAGGGGVGFDDRDEGYAASATTAYGEAGHGAGEYAFESGAPDAFSLAVQEAQQAAQHRDGADQGHDWTHPSTSTTDAPWPDGDVETRSREHAWFDVAEAAAMGTAPHENAGGGATGQQHAPDDVRFFPSEAPHDPLRAPAAEAYYAGDAYDRHEPHHVPPAYPPHDTAPPASAASTSSSSYGTNASMQDRFIEERKAKHAALLNLRQIEETGGVLSRKFTMDDPYDEIEYELDAYHHRRNHIQSIEMVHDKLKIAETVVMIVNSVAGQVLKRKGPIIAPEELKRAWSDTLDKHRVVIENVARKRYGPHAGSSAQSPEMQLGTALAMGIGGPILMSLVMEHAMGGGGGGGDQERDTGRQRRRRDDRRSALRRHRDEASGAAIGSDWRDSHNRNGSGGGYPEPPQDPFSRVPSLDTPRPQHESPWASSGGTQHPTHAAPAYPATGHVSQPDHYGKQQWEPSPIYNPSPPPAPMMDPYAVAGSPYVGQQQQQQPSPYAGQQQQQHLEYQQQQQQHHEYQQQQQQRYHAYQQQQQQQSHTAQTTPGAQQQQQQQLQTPNALAQQYTDHTRAGTQSPERVAHVQGAPAPRPLSTATQPSNVPQPTPPGAAPSGRRLMGRIAKPR